MDNNSDNLTSHHSQLSVCEIYDFTWISKNNQWTLHPFSPFGIQTYNFNSFNKKRSRTICAIWKRTFDKRCRLITIDWKIVVLTTECLGHCFTNNNVHSSSNERIMPYSIVMDPKRLSIALLWFFLSAQNRISFLGNCLVIFRIKK